MNYFFRTFVIYLLLIIGFSFIILDQNIDDLSGQDVESTVEFVYEAFWCIIYYHFQDFTFLLSFLSTNYSSFAFIKKDLLLNFLFSKKFFNAIEYLFCIACLTVFL